MNEKDWTEIVEIPEQRGFFSVKYHRLSIKSLRAMRTRLQSKTWSDRRLIASLLAQISTIRERVENNERIINTLTEDRILSAVAIEKTRKRLADENATAFLREWLGEKQYAELTTNGALVFKGLDGKTYRITKKGKLQERNGKYWYHKCVLRQPQLPLPDFIASVITATKNDPLFHAQSRRGTREEVQ